MQASYQSTIAMVSISPASEIINFVCWLENVQLNSSYVEYFLQSLQPLTSFRELWKNVQANVSKSGQKIFGAPLPKNIGFLAVLTIPYPL